MSNPQTLRVLTIVAENPGSGAPAVWARRQAESLKSVGIESTTHAFAERRSLGGLWRGAQELRSKIRECGADLVHVHYGASQALVAVLASPKPVVVSFCGSDLLGNYDARGRNTPSGRLSMLLSQLAALRAAGCIAKSEQLRDLLWWPWCRKRCEVIPNGVDLNEFKPMPQSEARALLGWTMDAPVVVFLTRKAGKWVKDPELAQKAYEIARQSVPELVFHVVEGEPADRIPFFLNAADALLLTSRHEGSNNAVKEAMSCNLPVVATACGDVPERLRGVAHSHVCSRDPQELGTRLAQVVAARQRSDGREHLRGLEEENIALKIRQCYEKVLKAR